MNLEEKVAKLHELIAQYLKLHAFLIKLSHEPDNAQHYKDVADKLLKTSPALAQFTNKFKKVDASKTLTDSVGENATNNSADVKKVQTELGLVVDGACTQATIEAIKKFQQDHKITPANGIIQPADATWLAIVEGGILLLPTTLKESVGLKGVNQDLDTRLIQDLLNKNGYEIAVNGKVEESTTKAIQDFQRRKQQNPTGLIEPNDATFKFLKGQEVAVELSEPTVKEENINKKLLDSVGQGGNNDRADVALVQKLLRENWGYNIPLDGEVKDSTIQAIRQFQHRFAGIATNQDALVEAGGNTIKYLTGELKPTEPYTKDGIIGGVETKLEKEMADFAKAFSGIRIEVNPGEWVVVRPPYHINTKKRRETATENRNKNTKVDNIIKKLGNNAKIGKASIAQIEDFLNQCIAAKLIPEKEKTSQGLHEFLKKYAISTDCSGLASQAANFLLENDLDRGKNETVKPFYTGSMRGDNGKQTKGQKKNFPKVSSPEKLRAGDMMVFRQEDPPSGHVRIIVDVDISDKEVAFTTVESGSRSDVGDGGDGIGQRRWKFPDKTAFKNLKLLEGNEWKTASSKRDTESSYVRMKELANLEE